LSPSLFHEDTVHLGKEEEVAEEQQIGKVDAGLELPQAVETPPSSPPSFQSLALTPPSSSPPAPFFAQQQMTSNSASSSPMVAVASITKLREDIANSADVLALFSSEGQPDAFLEKLKANQQRYARRLICFCT